MSEVTGDLTGVVAHRYRIDRKVGQGGMATVYRAHDERHDTQVAVKVLRPELASRLGGERFVREIRITAQFQHPNILPVFDSGEWQGHSFYVMPYVEGETLEERLKRSGPLPIEEAVSIAEEVADALAYAHERGFVHRDVKPSNIMLAHGHAMLADFGIARAIDAVGGDRLTETGLAIGTAAYMSPEQAHGDPIDGRADIYALGCVLYEMLAGMPPFTGSRRVVIARHSADTAPSLRIVRESVPEVVEQVITKAMAKTPADRFASAAEMRDVLRQAVTSQFAVVRPQRSAQRNALFLAIAAAAVTIAVIGVSRLLTIGRSDSELDQSRVLILPLRVSGNHAGPPSSGQDVSALLLAALGDAGNMQWLDGMAQMEPATRDTFGVPGLEGARRMARESRAAHFITGSITPVGGDSVRVELTLYNTATGDPVERAAPPESTTPESAWRIGLQAANQLLSRLIGGTSQVGAEWLDREPRAVASFLQGEAAFRRFHLDEAVDHFRNALTADPSFALAAIRGAQAAVWNHDPDEAGTLIDAAMNLPLPARYADFVHGFAAYLRGDADAAAAALRRTVRENPDMSEAWMQLGETYTHLLPEAGRPDSLALFAFEQARRIDPTATHLLLHMIEILLRRGERGDTATATGLLAEFRASEPDSSLLTKLDIMSDCVREGPGSIDWEGLAADRPWELLDASKSLSAAAARPACAMAGYRAVLAIDTSSTDGSAAGRRFAATEGLMGLLIAQGKSTEAEAVIDSSVTRWGLGTTLFPLVAIVDSTFNDRAKAVVVASRERFGPYSSWTSEFRLWVVGLEEARTGDLNEAEAIAAELSKRPPDPSGPGELMAQSVLAQVAAARGDSADARQRFEALVPAVWEASDMSWYEFPPQGVERLELARRLLDSGEFLHAIGVAEVFDSQAPLIYVLFTRASLELRLEAARRLENQFLIRRYQSRLDALSN